MQNYRIYCEENERAEIISILRKYNDVVIDNVNSNSVGITIELEKTTAMPAARPEAVTPVAGKPALR